MDVRPLHARFRAHLILLVVIGFGFLGCSPDPGKIDVTPDCPGGTRAASSVMVNANLSAIRPFGGQIKVRVRGNRTSTDVCFKGGAKSSFLETFDGTGMMTRNITNLADGNWTVNVTALSGGDQKPIELMTVLMGGVAHTLTVSGNPAGDLSATF